MRMTRSGSKTKRACAFAALATFALVSTGCGQQQAVAEIETMAVLTAGTHIVGALQSTVDTGRSRRGDKVALRTLEDIRVHEMTVVPAGATVHGEITHVDPTGRMAGGAELTIRFTELVMQGGTSYAISVVPMRLEGKGEAKESAIEVGAAAGATVGATIAVATKGDQIVLPAGQKMSVSLRDPVSIETKPGEAS
jgi:hypothetical protein